MQKIMDKIMDFVSVLAENITKYKFLTAIAETMQSLLGITMIGAFASMFAFLDIGPWQAFLATYPEIGLFFRNVQYCTLSIISLYVLILATHQYAEKLGMKQKILTVPIALAVFLLLTPVEVYQNIPTAWFGHQGMFSAMLVAFLVPRVIKFFNDHNITLRMPAGVPAIVENMFSVLVPAFVLCAGAGIIGRLMLQTEMQTVHNIVYTIIQAPLSSVGLSFPVYLLGQILSTVFMFCGIHGTTVTSPWLQPLLTAASTEQLNTYMATGELPNIICGAFQNAITIGGIGATLGLGILMVIVPRSRRYKQLGRMAIVPQIFNIGEPLLFGIPIMLNPVLFIPYVGGVVLNSFLVYGAVASGLVARFTGLEVAWTVPSPIKCMLGCSVPWQGLALCLVVLAIDMVLWYPFVKMIDRQALEEEKAAEAAKG